MAIPNFDEWEPDPQTPQTPAQPQPPPAYDDWVKTQSFAPLDTLKSFAAQNNLEVGSTTGGRHNRGSKHYVGQAVDIRNSGGLSNQQVQQLSQAAAAQGLKLRDERQHPKGQAVWGGPHIHLEATDQQIPRFDDWQPPSGQTPPPQSQNRVNQPLSATTTPPVQPRQPSVPIEQALANVTAQTNRIMRRRGIATQPQAVSQPRGPEVIDAGNAEPDEQMIRERIRQQVRKETPAPLRTPFDENRTPDLTAENEEVEGRYQAMQRARTPEMTDIRKEYGQMSAPTRAVAQPLVRGGAQILKLVGGVTSLAGIAPNQLSNWANARAQIAEEGSQLAPLTAEGEEIKRGIPEKVAQGVADLGIGIGQIVLLKKATGLPFNQLMALESALKTSDQPVGERAKSATEAYALGTVLDQHLSRAASAALFGGPTAIQSAGQVARGQMSPEDALIQTGVQTGAGALLGGRKPSSLERGLERLPPAEQVEPNATIAAKLRGENAARPTTPEPNTPELPAETAAQPEAVEPPHHSNFQPRRVRGGGKGQFKAGKPEMPEPEPQSASVPFMITKQMEADLRGRGLSQGDINKLTPQQANDILAQPDVGAVGVEPSASAPAASELAKPTEGAASEYNAAKNDPLLKESFQSRSTRMGIANAVERRRDPFLKPDWKTASDGNLLAVPQGRDFEVYPKFGLTIENVGVHAGGMADIYDFPDFPSTKHRITGQVIPEGDVFLQPEQYEVSKPAIFSKEGDSWKLLQKGEIRTAASGQGSKIVAPIEGAIPETSPTTQPEGGAGATTEPLAPRNPTPTQAPEGATVPPSTTSRPLPTTSQKQAHIAAERESMGFEPLPEKTPRPDVETRRLAEERNAKNPDEPRRLVEETLKKPRTLSDVEVEQLNLYQQRLKNEYNRLRDDTNPANAEQNSLRASQIEDEFNQIGRAGDRTDTEAGRSLRALRFTTNEDYDILPMLKNYRLAKGAEPSAEVRTQLESAAARIKDLEKQIAEQGAKVDKRKEGESLNATDKFIREQKLELRRQGRARTREALRAEREDLKQEFAKAWAKMKPKSTTLSMGGLGDLDPNGELSRIAVKIARSHIEEGVSKAADLVDAVHNSLKDVADNLTKRQVSDLISGYGRIRKATVDPVERKLNELKSILAATSGKVDVLEQGIRPSRRGQQREKPTEDQRRALRELQDAMAEHPEISRGKPSETEQQTPLDKAKATTRNRIEQLKSWIDSGKKEVEGRTKVVPDSELVQLKAERDALQKVANLLDDPQADQRAVERRISELNKSIVETRTKIQSGATGTEAKGQYQRWSPEIGRLEKERAALRQIATDMRNQPKGAEPKASFYGATGTWADYEAQARRILARRRGLEKQLADLQAGRPKAEPKPLPHDETTERLKLTLEREKRKVDAINFKAKAEKEWAARSRLSKLGAYTAAATRASVLSGVKTVGKIASALGQRVPQQYAEEGFARGYGKAFPETAAKATRFGGHMTKASEAAATKGFAAGVKEIPHILKTGDTELSQKFNDYHQGIPTKLGRALEVPGRVHFSEKNPLLRAEYARSREIYLDRAERLKSGSRNDPLVVDAAEREAYKNAKEVILMGDNPISRAFTRAQQGMQQSSRDLIRTIVPVHRVAGNYLSQMVGDYGLGVFRGAVRALHERNPEVLKNMTPAEADKTMRLLQRGSLGLVYLAIAGTPIGAALGLQFGGFYKRGRKDEVKPQDVKIGPATISHTFLHSPPDELAQLGASMLQEWRENPDKSAAGRLASGAARSGLGVLEQTPFVNDVTEIPGALQSGDSLSNYLGRELASRMEPQILRDVASSTDTQKRQPKGLGDQFRMGIPGLRQQVPINHRGEKSQRNATLTDQFRSGKITSDDLQSLVDNETITEADKAKIEKLGALTDFQSRFASIQYPSTALDKYERMNAAQRSEVEDLMTKRAKSLVNSKSLTQTERDKFRERLEKVGINPE